MKVALTKELLNYLHNEGYTYLVAENQAANDWYTFKPVEWDHDAFFAECLTTDFDDHMILSIQDALRTFLFEEYLNHEVVMP